jgi:hypothetical protein
VAVGFNPSEFWAQTPRSFVAIMEGAARAAKSKFESETALAWQTANFSAAAQCGKLRALKYYIETEKKSHVEAGDEILAHFKALQASGAKMNIRKVN